MNDRNRKVTHNYRTARIACLIAIVVIGTWILFHDTSWAQGFGRPDDEPTLKDYIYRLIRSGFGTLVMVFCGLGGFAILYMKREGAGGGSAPVIGIVLLIVAVFMFIFRVMITSGIMGSRYLDYGP